MSGSLENGLQEQPAPGAGARPDDGQRGDSEH